MPSPTPLPRRRRAVLLAMTLALAGAAPAAAEVATGEPTPTVGRGVRFDGSALAVLTTSSRQTVIPLAPDGTPGAAVTAPGLRAAVGLADGRVLALLRTGTRLEAATGEAGRLGARTTLQTGVVAGSPQLVAGPDGAALAVWHVGRSVRWAARPAGGAFGRFRVAGHADPRTPIVAAAGPGGRLLLAWGGRFLRVGTARSGLGAARRVGGGVVAAAFSSTGRPWLLGARNQLLDPRRGYSRDIVRLTAPGSRRSRLLDTSVDPGSERLVAGPRGTMAAVWSHFGAPVPGTSTPHAAIFTAAGAPAGTYATERGPTLRSFAFAHDGTVAFLLGDSVVPGPLNVRVGIPGGPLGPPQPIPGSQSLGEDLAFLPGTRTLLIAEVHAEIVATEPYVRFGSTGSVVLRRITP